MNTSWKMRPYQGEEDYWRIRAFLREVFLLNGRQERSWQVARLDYWRWHVVQNCEEISAIEDVIYIWEDAEGHIGAVLTPEGAGEAFLHVHPATRSAELEAEMLAVAEAHYALTGEGGERKLQAWAHEDDPLRQELLAQRGYVKGQWPETQFARSLDLPIPDVAPPRGYTVRSLGGDDELPARSWVSWRAFHADEPDEKYDGWEWYRNLLRLPLYRRDLDIVATAPHGGMVAFCTLWYDDVTRTGYFEPVGVDPNHHRRGLGKAVMFEAMRRMRAMGGKVVTVAGYSPAAIALYTSVTGSELLRSERWVKSW